MSTAKVFGEGREASYRETDPAAPEDDYARSKLAAEEGLLAIGRETGLEIVVLRPPLVYGPGVRANFLSLVRAVDRGVLLPLGSVRNRRSLISVANLARAIIPAIWHPAAAGHVFSVTDGEDVSTPDLIRKIASTLGKPARLFPFPVGALRVGAAIAGKRGMVDRLVDSLTLDTTAIRTALRWHPHQSLENGLADLARWYREGTTIRAPSPGSEPGDAEAEMDIVQDGWFDIAEWVNCARLERPGYTFEVQNAEGLSVYSTCAPTVIYPTEWASPPQRFRIIRMSHPGHTTPMVPHVNG